ncbi:TonB-dependent receptor [Bradyrhizobium sp.]|uniref:TonB-dependent receptor n=1 Tax=Bradyrhizobium sp. TaxID=376 RepID=UPI0039E364AF
MAKPKRQKDRAAAARRTARRAPAAAVAAPVVAEPGRSALSSNPNLTLAKVDAGVSVVTAEQLRQNDVRSVDDLQKVFPGLVIENRGNRAYANFTVRGVSSPDFYNPAVQVYIDGVPQASAAMVQDLENVDHVEFLRGPQGTLFGRTGYAGVLNIVTRQPRENAATVFGTVGDRRKDAGFAATGALVPDTLFLDLSLKAVDQIGQIKDSNGTNDAIDGSRSINGRVGLRYAPKGGPFDFNVWASHENLTSNEETAILDSDVPSRIYRSSVIAFPYNRIDRDITTTGLNWNYRFGEFTLSSTTSYQNVELKRQLFGFQFPETTGVFNQEVKVAYNAGGPFKAVAGVSYYNETFERNSYVGLAMQSLNKVGSQGVAVFGEGTYAITNRLDLTVGARGSIDWSSINYTGLDLSTFAPLAFTNKAEFQGAQPKVSLGYQVTDEVRLYGLVSEGYKAGGFNHAVSFAADASPYKPETAWNYEIGTRTNLWNGRFVFTSALYYIASQDKQIYVGPVGLQVIRNAGEAVSKGIEFEATLKPTDRLTFTANANFGRSEFTNFVDPLSGVNYNGKQVPYAPDVTANLFGRYVFDQHVVPFDIALTGAAHYFSQVYFNESNTLGQGAYTTYDVGLEFLIPRGPTFKIYAQNLTDVVYRTNSFAFSGTVLSTIGQGRLVGVSGRWQF